MITDVIPAEGGLPPGLSPRANNERPVGRVTGLVPLLFALNFAVGLPPKAIVSPPGPAWPTVLPSPRAIVSSDDLAAVLGRAILDLSRGRVRLGQVDERLRGLVVSLAIFRVIEGAGALIGLGVVSSEGTPSGGTPIADLWKLAREALVQHGVPSAHPGNIGDDAFLVEYGQTAQLAWLTGDSLATVSVTHSGGEQDWIIRAARAVAAFADYHLVAQDNLHRSVPT